MILNPDKLKQRYSVNQERFDRYSKVLKFALGFVKYMETPVIGRLIKKLVLMDSPENHHTQGYTLNIDKRLHKDEANGNVTLPIELVRRLVKESEHRYKLMGCICRTGNSCKDYPIDFGCLFLGEGGQVCEKNGIAEAVSVEEALQHVEKAQEYGLIAQALYAEVEKYLWGIEEDRLENWIELCFCCPCCCLGFQLLKHAGPEVRDRIQSVGWKASVTEQCTSCGECVTACSFHSISLWNNKTVSIAENCLGCGVCASRCPENAIELKQVLPVKNRINEYFRGYTPKP